MKSKTPNGSPPTLVNTSKTTAAHAQPNVDAPHTSTDRYEDSPKTEEYLRLVAIEPHCDSLALFEISSRDWRAAARILAAGDNLDARVVAQLFDPQPGYEFTSDVCEDMDVSLLGIIEWLERLRADRIYLSASVVRIRDEHSHIDPTTTFLDLQEWAEDPGLDASLLRQCRNFIAFSGGFKIHRVSSMDAAVTDAVRSAEGSDEMKCSAASIRMMDFEEGDDDADLRDDVDSGFDWCRSIGTTVGTEHQSESCAAEFTQEASCCHYCGVEGCSACTYNEMYALDLIGALCGFAVKQADTLEQSVHLVRALCDSLVLQEGPDGWIEWRGAIDPEIATIATHAIRSDGFLVANLGMAFAQPSELLITVYQTAQHRALEEIRSGLPPEIRPADVRVYW